MKIETQKKYVIYSMCYIHGYYQNIHYNYMRIYKIEAQQKPFYSEKKKRKTLLIITFFFVIKEEILKF